MGTPAWIINLLRRQARENKRARQARLLAERDKLFRSIAHIIPPPIDVNQNNQTLQPAEESSSSSTSATSANSVLNLDFLLNVVMSGRQQLDWESFSHNELRQPLRVIASSVHTLKPVVLSRAGRHYDSLPGLLDCIRASMSVPGLTGPLMGLPSHSPPPSPSRNHSDHSTDPSESDAPTSSSSPSDGVESKRPFYIHRHPTHGHEALVDAFLCEPVPYRSAVEEGATHVLVLCTKPEHSKADMAKRPGLFERLIVRRFLARQGHSSAARWVMDMHHHRAYVRDSTYRLH